MPLTDEELERHIRTAATLILRYLHKKTRNRELAEDLSQETLVRIHKFGRTFDPEKGEFNGWALRIAHNVMVTHLTKAGRSAPVSSLDASTGETIDLPAPGSLETSFEQKNLLEEIKKAIRCLPEPEKSVVINKEIKGMKLADNAQALGLSIRTVNRKLLTAYELLRNELEKRGVNPREFDNE